MAESQRVSIILELEENLSKAFKDIARAMDALTKKMKDTEDAVNKVEDAAEDAADALKEVGKQGVDAGDKGSASMKELGKSTENAAEKSKLLNSIMKRLSAAAVLGAAINAAKQLGEILERNAMRAREIRIEFTRAGRIGGLTGRQAELLAERIEPAEEQFARETLTPIPEIEALRETVEMLVAQRQFRVTEAPERGQQELVDLLKFLQDLQGTTTDLNGVLNDTIELADESGESWKDLAIALGGSAQTTNAFAEEISALAVQIQNASRGRVSGGAAIALAARGLQAGISQDQITQALPVLFDPEKREKLTDSTAFGRLVGRDVSQQEDLIQVIDKLASIIEAAPALGAERQAFFVGAAVGAEPTTFMQRQVAREEFLEQRGVGIDLTPSILESASASDIQANAESTRRALEAVQETIIQTGETAAAQGLDTVQRLELLAENLRTLATTGGAAVAPVAAEQLSIVEDQLDKALNIQTEALLGGLGKIADNIEALNQQRAPAEGGQQGGGTARAVDDPMENEPAAQ